MRVRTIVLAGLMAGAVVAQKRKVARDRKGATS